MAARQGKAPKKQVGGGVPKILQILQQTPTQAAVISSGFQLREAMHWCAGKGVRRMVAGLEATVWHSAWEDGHCFLEPCVRVQARRRKRISHCGLRSVGSHCSATAQQHLALSWSVARNTFSAEPWGSLNALTRFCQ